jgi:hypothetical protein
LLRGRPPFRGEWGQIPCFFGEDGGEEEEPFQKKTDTWLKLKTPFLILPSPRSVGVDLNYEQQ